MLCIATNSAFSQGHSGNGSKGHSEVVGDTKVTDLVKKHIDFNEQVKTVPGYRIQIASLSGSNSRTEAFRKKDQFVTTFPNVEAYVIFNEPNFRVVVGDFITRLDAYLFLQRSKSLFPGTIVKDDVYPIRLNWDEIVPEADTDANN